MPDFDSTGPEGQGPRTGRQMGRCKPRKGSDDPEQNTNKPEDESGLDKRRFAGRGLGRGGGFGRGRRRGFGGGGRGNI